MKNPAYVIRQCQPCSTCTEVISFVINLWGQLKTNIKIYYCGLFMFGNKFVLSGEGRRNTGSYLEL